MLKILFLFFLLLNAVYFYTQFEGTAELTSSTVLKQPALPQGVNKLVMLRERGLGGENAPFQESPADKLSAKPIDMLAKPLELQDEPSCFTLGPFTRADVAKRNAGTLAALGADVKHREISQRTPRGYWVYLPSSKSYQAAKRKATELQKKGLNDLYIMGKGSHQNAISLGLFTRESAANSRFQQVKKLGLKAVLETQYRTSKQIWLDLTVPGSQAATVANITEMVGSLQRAKLGRSECQ
ncbi:MAG: SPOR domain-containing protein [Gammaproteobacteria bacterium]|nr:SPOR domain-containing protein [Gammaproteobacteria bacterium]